MIKVMRRIVEEQREFFERGVEGLKPLTLQQIANQIGMHESTVSRVTTNKYVQTPRGVFELKYFFSSGLATEEGDDVSAKVAKDKILTLINNEDKREPLSDQRVAEILHERHCLHDRMAITVAQGATETWQRAGCHVCAPPVPVHGIQSRPRRALHRLTGIEQQVD